MKRVAIVGATGAVGQEFCAVLAARKFPAASCRMLASARSAGKRVDWAGSSQVVEELAPAAFDGIDVAFFSAGASVSREFAPLAAKRGALVVDNSSAFRMDPNVPLVVPEVNPQDARSHQGIIANPNCSTIILVVPLWPLHQAAGVKRVVVSTYQAASGAGARALAELETQTREVLAGRQARPEVFPVPCAFNVFSHNTTIGDDGYNVEERKMVLETHKIFGDSSIGVAPTCMRVPVMRAHTESLSIEFARPLSEQSAREILAKAPGVRVVDDRARNYFPMPLDATGQDEVLVGRIRQDASVPEGRGLQFICSGDQLLKGAALNAVQIAELLL
ncbi:Aspartate-semialdehyde dehydrogenase [Phycisphaerae bacterium RAS1]|nr:Aspartate-semialdehyde dehydrogenase [Phycisphaerae bacterium RAS1]